MKKMLLISAMAAATMLSCTKTIDDNGLAIPNGQGQVPVHFSQSIQTIENTVTISGSKAIVAGSALATNEKFTVYGVNYTGTWQTNAWTATNFIDKKDVTVDAGGLTVAGGPYYYSNEANANYNFYAFYPNTLTVKDPAAGTAPEVSVSCTPANITDLMWAKVENKSRNDADVKFIFAHKLAQVTVMLTADKPAAGIVIKEASIPAKTSATMNLETGVVTVGADVSYPLYTATGEDTGISIGDAGSGTAEAAKQIGVTFTLPEQTISTINLKINDATEAVPVSLKDLDNQNGVKLAPGTKTTITLTIKEKNVSFGGQEVTAWQNGGNTNNGGGEI